MLVLVKCFDIKMVKSPGGLHAANQQKKELIKNYKIKKNCQMNWEKQKLFRIVYSSQKQQTNYFLT